MTHRLSLLGAVVVVVAAVSGGCGGGNSSSGSTAASTTSTTPASGGAVIKTITVHEREYKLSPSSIALTKPGTYVFKGVNDGMITHSLAIKGNGVDKHAANIAPGSTGTVQVTLTKAGSYEIYCPIDGHKAQGMQGTVTVGGAGASGGTSTQGTTTTNNTTTSGRYSY